MDLRRKVFEKVLNNCYNEDGLIVLSKVIHLFDVSEFIYLRDFYTKSSDEKILYNVINSTKEDIFVLNEKLQKIEEELSLIENVLYPEEEDELRWNKLLKEQSKIERQIKNLKINKEI